MQDVTTESTQLRAAQYVRMSTEHQQYSTENQIAAIQQYARTHNIQIVRSFIDAGKSGVRLAGRYALQELIGIVEKKQADFNTILVYDISRWGRFQDTDESAFYEYLCKRAGVPSVGTYLRRFGCLENVYKSVGYVPSRNQRYGDIKSATLKIHKKVSTAITKELRDSGALVEGDDSKGVFTINGEYTVRLMVARCRRLRTKVCWILNRTSASTADIVVIARLGSDNKSVHDYYFFSDIVNFDRTFKLCPQNPMLLDACRSRNLEPLIRTARRVNLLDIR